MKVCGAIGVGSSLVCLLTVANFVIAQDTLTVVGWGGAAAKAQAEGYHKSFIRETGIGIKFEDYTGGLAQIRSQVDSGAVHWDVVDVESASLRVGCDEGVFEDLSDIELPPAPDATPASEDFLDGMIGDCGIGAFVWATVLVYNANDFDDDVPSTIADMFDLAKFPGRRGMRRSPAVNLEWALIADGVSTDRVYKVLSTEEGLERAFRKLDTIKDHVVWWEAGAQPSQLLADQEVVMTSAWNGRIFYAQVMENQSFEIIWNGHIRDYDAFAIVAGSPNLEIAKRFIAHATSTRGMVGFASYIPYAPVRKSGLELVGKHATKSVDMLPHLPTAPANSETFLWNDVEWWSEREDELTERFNAWLAR
ncbi:MAG: ABC transporter substrate-binding protein [Gammaproteobacteria bacterium]|nr:ABC transporter substrate-binding protein [Gammaproteobacteria bacterium]